MKILDKTIELRGKCRALYGAVSKEVMIASSRVTVDVPSFDITTEEIRGMTHTPVSGTGVYQTVVNLRNKTVRCSCEAGGFGRVCKHTVRLARWLDQRLEADQRAIEHSLHTSLIGASLNAQLIEKRKAS